MASRLTRGLLVVAGAAAVGFMALGMKVLLEETEVMELLREPLDEIDAPFEPEHVAFMATTTIATSAEKVAALWQQAESLPVILRFLHRVEVLDATRRRWTLRGSTGASLELELDLARDEAPGLLLWHVTGQGVTGSVRVELREVSDAKTELTVYLDFRRDEEGLEPSAPLETFFGSQPATRLADDLRRLGVGLERGFLRST